MNNRRGTLHFETEEFNLIPILRCLYELESTKVSGPASYTRKLTDCVWTRDELVEHVRRKALDDSLIDELLKKMKTENQILVLPECEENPKRYLSRLGETIRLLGHTYEYWHRGWPAIKATRWVVEDKTVPKRIIPVKEVISRLLDKISSKLGEGPNTHNLRTAIELVFKAAAKYIVRTASEWEKACFSEFQYEAIESMILNEYSEPQRRSELAQVLIAGVGSGKTFAFAIPLLVSVLAGVLGGPKSERISMFLYPRTALARNQYEVLNGITKYIRNKHFRLHLEHVTNPLYRDSVRKGIAKRYAPGNVPHVIVTTLETLKRRLQHPIFVQGVNSLGLKHILLDEIHLISGLSGTKTARLMARLSASLKREDEEILWTASSATIASPDEHVSKIFGIPKSSVKILEPRDDHVEKVGLAHHVFLRASEGVSHIGTLVNATSILVHNRRHNLGDRDISYKQRSIGFADTLDALGRWNADFRENERTEGIAYFKGDGHPTSLDPSTWKPRNRELPYALRYLNPLSRRMAVAQDKNGVYTPILEGCAERDPCRSCREGKRHILGELTPEEMQALGLIVYRNPAKPTDDVIHYKVMNPVFRPKESVKVGTLDFCPFLEAAACHWFPVPNLEIAPIPDSSTHFTWANIARSKIHSSKTSAGENDGDIEDIVFSGSTQELYDVSTPHNSIPCDVVLASPSLEVGVDIGDVTESIMYKAIRNVASYRQKAGRVGREIGTDSVNVTLLVENPVDLHYYRQPLKLTSKGHLDPIPLEERNELILENALYSGVWDYLARIGELPEAIPLKVDEFSDKLRICYNILSSSESDIIEHLAKIIRVQDKNDIPMDMVRTIRDVIGQVKDEIGFLLTDVHTSFKINVINVAADIIPYILRTGRTPPIDGEILDAYDEIDTQIRTYIDRRPSIDPIDLGIDDELIEIDAMVECGWVPDRLENLTKSIEMKVKRIPDENSRHVRQLRKILPSLKEIYSQLKKVQDLGMNPLVFEFYRQFKDYCFERTTQRKAFYLSYVMMDLKVFQILKKRRSFVRPENLFSHPHEEKVKIVRLSLNGETVLGEDEIQIGESLFGYLPGTWTFRLGKHPFKTIVGNIGVGFGPIIEANLSQMSKSGHQFAQEEGEYNIPFLDDTKLKLYRPVKLMVRQCRKLVPKKAGSTVLADGDESEYLPNEPRLTVPRSFGSKWVDVRTSQGTPIYVNKHGKQSLEITKENSDDLLKSNEALSRIRHPLFSKLIEDITWHENLRVSELVYEVQRTYNSPDVSGVTIRYVAKDRPAALGRRLLTEGICIDLQSKLITRIVDELSKKILSGNREWLPSSIRMIEAAISVNNSSDSKPSLFVIRDLIDVIVTGILEEKHKKDQPLVDMIKEIILSDDFYEKVGYFLNSGPSIPNDDFNPEESEKPLQVDAEEILSARSDAILDLSKEFADLLETLPNFTKDWVAYTLVNTFGSVACDSLRRFSGVQSHDVGYTIDVNKKEGKYRVILYDNNHQGNGSSALVRDYLHILHIQRHADRSGKYLPSYDFLSILEENLMQCSQFHQDINALRMMEEYKSGGSPSGYSELSYVKPFSIDIFNIGQETWEALDVCGPNDAWKLPLIRRVCNVLGATHEGINDDDLLRATGICWNGCPECVDVSGGAMGSIARGAFIDKYVLDYWFEEGIETTKEYAIATMEEISKGALFRQMGLPTRIKMKQGDVALRLVHLPHTVGFNISRTRQNYAQDHIARILVRTSDVVGLEAVNPTENQYPIPEEGYERLVWFTLLMSSYLDRVGLLAPADKLIDLVFYAVTDIPVNQAGLSLSLIETIEHFRRASNFNTRLEYLSDVLNWLAETGFRIRLCIDEDTISNPHTTKLLRNLQPNSNLEVYKAKSPGRMHKKMLVTPLGAVTGSSNLTRGGTEWNVETVHYTGPGTSGYDAIRMSANDTITDFGEIIDVVNEI